MTVHNPLREGQLNLILDILGTTSPWIVPGWESVGSVVTAIGAGGHLTSSDEAGAVTLESEFAPNELPCGLYSYEFVPAGNLHLSGADAASHSFGDASVDSPFSVGAWIRPNAIASLTILSKYSATVREWRLHLDSNGLLTFDLYDESVDATEIAASTSAIELGKMQFVVASYDGTETAPVLYLYVNGAAVNDGSTTETNSYVAMENTATPVLVGAHGVTGTPVQEFNGRIWLPFITGKALTAAEVKALYALTVPMVGIV